MKHIFAGLLLMGLVGCHSQAEIDLARDRYQNDLRMVSEAAKEFRKLMTPDIGIGDVSSGSQSSNPSDVQLNKLHKWEHDLSAKSDLEQSQKRLIDLGRAAKEDAKKLEELTGVKIDIEGDLSQQMGLSRNAR